MEHQGDDPGDHRMFGHQPQAADGAEEQPVAPGVARQDAQVGVERGDPEGVRRASVETNSPSHENIGRVSTAALAQKAVGSS